MNKERPLSVIISCEHAANKIPEAYRHLFAPAQELLLSHRGYDIGAAELARCLSARLKAPLFISKYSRLLADLNRHSRHRDVFSRFTVGLDVIEKQRILKKYHAPYRMRLENRVRKDIESGRRVLHLSVHSFTPELNGTVRNADIGFLYDPKHGMEKQLARCFLNCFKNNLNQLRYRCNYPYLGVSDSLTTFLRKAFPADAYAGIEFEINQQLASGDARDWESFKTRFAETVRIALASAQKIHECGK